MEWEREKVGRVERVKELEGIKEEFKKYRDEVEKRKKVG